MHHILDFPLPRPFVVHGSDIQSIAVLIINCMGPINIHQDGFIFLSTFLLLTIPVIHSGIIRVQNEMAPLSFETEHLFVEGNENMRAANGTIEIVPGIV